MHLQRILVLVFSFLGIISVFIPWYNVDLLLVKSSVNGMEGNGILLLLLFTAVIVLSLVSDLKLKIQAPYFWAILVASLIVSTLGIIELYTVSNQSNTLLGSIITNAVELGYGIYLLIISGVGIAGALCLFQLKH